MVSTDKIRTAATFSFAIGFALMGLFTLLRPILGIQMNLVPGAIAVVNRETIPFTLGVVAYFVLYQVLAITRGEKKAILDLAFIFLVYWLAMAFYAFDITSWIRFGMWTNVVLGIEHFVLLKFRENIQLDT